MASFSTHYIPQPTFSVARPFLPRDPERFEPFAVCLRMIDDADKRTRYAFGVRHGSLPVLQASTGGTWADVFAPKFSVR